MKAFDQYLAEADKEYAFRLRVATDLEEGVMDKIENRLKKYEAFSISTPKKTMFQASPPGFAHLPGAELNIVDFKTRQAVAPHVLQQDIIEASDLPESQVRVNNANEPLIEETPEGSDQTDENAKSLFDIHKYCVEDLKCDTHAFQFLKGSPIQHSDIMFDLKKV